ncbi:MAG: chromate efflux transporter [Caldilineaceae bacterium]|nr:chromate efflux transporter [Caldilineaceae bacterium]
MPTEQVPNRQALREVTTLFLRLGFTAFGGPAAHIAMMHDEVVTRRRWMTEQHFLDLVGATNLIPGPNSTEMAIHIGYARAGWRGLLAAGLCFILPAVVIVLLLAWAYTTYGHTPQGDALMVGIKPVIIAIVVQALARLVPTALKGTLLGVVGIAALVLYLLGVNELLVLFGGAFVVVAVQAVRRFPMNVVALLPLLSLPRWLPQAAEPVVSLDRLFLIFLKVGALLYGSGYVLLAFLRNDLVLNGGWLTDQQLLDAVAVGQFTPGPVFTTATFIGYVLAGVPGAVVATIAIFLPSFCFVALLTRLVPYIRRSPWSAVFLDGINVTALGLMAGVTWQLGRAAVIDLPTLLLAVGAAILLFRFKINSAWLVVAGAVIGLVIG